MRKLLLLVMITLPLTAQVVAVKSTSTTVTASAGTLVATFISQFPPPTTGVQVSITDTSITPVFKQTFNQPLPVGASNAATGQINTGAGAISWSLALPTAGGAITYSVASTPTGGVTSTGTGTF